MTTIEESVELAVPARHAYDQWTQFEHFPKFVSGLVRVTQRDERRVDALARIGGKELPFEAEITEQLPDKRIAWKSVAGTAHAGVVTFHRLDDGHSKVMLQFDYEPEGVLETVGDLLGITRRWTRELLDGFRDLVESQDAPTGGWRGTIPAPGERHPSTAGN